MIDQTSVTYSLPGLEYTITPSAIEYTSGRACENCKHYDRSLLVCDRLSVVYERADNIPIIQPVHCGDGIVSTSPDFYCKHFQPKEDL